jgi:hypothetical protein
MPDQERQNCCHQPWYERPFAASQEDSSRSIEAGQSTVGRLPQDWLLTEDDKHVVIDREFAKDESSILSTSNHKWLGKFRAFFIDKFY